MKKSYVTATFAMLLLAGCSAELKDSDIKFATESGAKVSFSAVINTQDMSDLVSRATETNWEVGDTVGITCGDRQVNVEYEYTGNAGGLFAAKDGYAAAIWVLGTQEYDVTAYFPFAGPQGEVPVPIAVSTKGEYQATAKQREKIDFLYASGKATAAQPNVKLSFNHVMSRIKLTFVPGQNVTLGDITCYLINLRTEGTFNPVTGATAVDETKAVEDMVWDKVGIADNHTIQAMVLPQTVDNGKEVYLQAGMNGYYYEVHFPNLKELKSGVSYNYTIQANAYTDNPFVLTVTDESQIVGWKNEEGGTIESDPSIAGTGTETEDPKWTITEENVTPTAK